MELDDFSPVRLLQRDELNALRKLRRRVERIHLNRRLDGLKPAAQQKGAEHFWDEWRAVHAELEARSFDAIRGALGIGEHSVLHIIRDDGHESWFQLRSAELSAFFDGQEAWAFEGGALKKDKSIGAGTRRGGMTFRLALMERRRLDGQWERVRQLQQ